MRPCNHCGQPIPNSHSCCDACSAAREVNVAACEPTVTPPADESKRDAVDSAAELGVLFLLGLVIRLALVAVGVIACTQIFTGFRMPLATSCYIGIGIATVYTAFDGLAHVLARRWSAKETE